MPLVVKEAYAPKLGRGNWEARSCPVALRQTTKAHAAQRQCARSCGVCRSSTTPWRRLTTQRPLSLAALTENATAAGWKTTPSWYLVAEHDNAIAPDAERFMADRMGATTKSIAGSHTAFIAQPVAVAAFIAEALAAFLSPTTRRLNEKETDSWRTKPGPSPARRKGFGLRWATAALDSRCS